jgi:hypothetical protein
MVTTTEIEEQIAKLHEEGKTSKYISGVLDESHWKNSYPLKLVL